MCAARCACGMWRAWRAWPRCRATAAPCARWRRPPTACSPAAMTPPSRRATSARPPARRAARACTLIAAGRLRGLCVVTRSCCFASTAWAHAWCSVIVSLACSDAYAVAAWGGRCGTATRCSACARWRATRTTCACWPWASASCTAAPGTRASGACHPSLHVRCQIAGLEVIVTCQSDGMAGLVWSVQS